jgi:methyltransferase (TIGR00027 family)
MTSMKEERGSRTALGTAFIRGYHSRYDSPRIFDDTLAFGLLSEAERSDIVGHLMKRLQTIDPSGAASSRNSAGALQRVLQLWSTAPTVLSRARYAEDALWKAISKGVRQYVILGAGMDTFAFRHKEILDRLQVFEVDHPGTQALKRERIAGLGWQIPAQLHFIPLDFARENLAEMLSYRPYDPTLLTFWGWLGVTYYLSRDSVFATLQAITKISPQGSAVVFDYFDPGEDCTGKEAERLKAITDSLQALGEPMKGGLDSSSLTFDLAGIGLRLQENLAPSDIQQRYFKGRLDGYRASRHTRFAAAVVKGGSSKSYNNSRESVSAGKEFHHLYFQEERV